MNGIQNADGLIKAIRMHKIVIYGTGYVAERFFGGIIRYSLQDQILCYIESVKTKDQFKGKPVYSLNKLDLSILRSIIEGGVLVCVAVHEANRSSIIEELERIGIHNHIWIYPYLHDFCIGRPMEKDVDVSVRKLVDKCRDDYRICIRVLAIEQFYGTNNLGDSIYIKTQSAHCGQKTAERRLEAFMNLIRNWDYYGYDQKNCIKIAKDMSVLDGLHRLSLAFYHGIPTIRADVYSSLLPDGFIGDDAKISEDVVSLAGLSEREMCLLHSRQREIYRKEKQNDL